MERARAQLRLLCDEEDRERRTNQRKRKRGRFVEGENVKEKENHKEEDNEQPGPSDTQRHATQENRLWPVICGNKTGILDVAKLQRAEECIKCEGRWFSPPAFEELGGEGSCKKWKASIFSENKSLQYWFEQGCLTTEGFQRRRSGNKMDEIILSSDCTPESSPDDVGVSKETEQCGRKKKDRKTKEMGPGMQRRYIKGFEETENTNKEKLDMSRSEESEHFKLGIPVMPPQRQHPYKGELRMQQRRQNSSFAMKSESELVENESDSAATTSPHGAVQLQQMSQDTMALQATQASDIPQSSPPVLAPLSWSSSCDLDTMEFDQLKREKIKMQIKVLKLQEEYYTKKIRQLKK